MTLSTKEEAMDALERARAEWLAEARAIAVIIHGVTGKPVTVDDVRAVSPPPAGTDGRVFGALFNGPEWELVGYVRSERRTCHKRPIGQFVRVG